MPDSSFVEELEGVLGMDSGEPEAPEEPEASETPETPETSEELEEPETPEAPEEPEDSGEPETPEEPGEPGEPEDELTTLKKQNELLLKQLEEHETPKKPEEPAEDGPPKGDELPSFLSEEDDVDSILSSREKLNEFAQKIFAEAKKYSDTQVLERTLRALPPIMVEQVQRQLVLREGIQEYFRENQDLAVAKRTFGRMMNEVVAEKPEARLKEVMEDAGERTRKLLGIKKRAASPGGGNSDKGDRNPALVDKGNSGRKGQSDRRSGLQKEVDDLTGGL